jgi:hypothetical protein
MEKFNDLLAEKLSNWLSTMACFYFICFLDLLTLFFQRPHDAQGWIVFWVSVFFQGVALPVLGYIQKVEGEKQAKLLKETHDTVMQELAELKEILSLLNSQNKEEK